MSCAWALVVGGYVAITVRHENAMVLAMSPTERTVYDLEWRANCDLAGALPCEPRTRLFVQATLVFAIPVIGGAVAARSILWVRRGFRLQR